MIEIKVNRTWIKHILILNYGENVKSKNVILIIGNNLKKSVDITEKSGDNFQILDAGKN